jgi:hypothetical protein
MQALRPSLTTRRRRPCVVLAAGLAATLWAGLAVAHDFWIEPSSYRPKADHPLALRLRVGELFLGDALPRDGALLRRFEAATSNGNIPILGVDGRDPAGFLRLRPAEGDLVAIYESAPSTTDMTPEAFATYLEQEGLTAIAAERATRGLVAGRDGARDAFSRHAKVLLRPASAVAASESPFTRAHGLELELRPLRDPARVGAEEKLEVELTFRGQPLADTQVVAIPRRRPQTAQVVRTDGRGRASFRLEPGEWLLKAVHVVPRAQFGDAVTDAGDADYRSFWTSLTFAIP